MSGEIAHMLCLDLPAQLLAQFMSSTLDDRIMRDPHDGALHPIKRYRNFRRLMQELVKFSLSLVVLPSWVNSFLCRDLIFQRAPEPQSTTKYPGSPIDDFGPLLELTEAGVHPPAGFVQNLA